MKLSSARVIRGVGANALAQIVTLAVQLLLVPIMATQWGLERYGVWIVLSSVPSYLALSDFGFATAAASEMTMRVARGDKEGALTTFQSAWSLILAVSAAIIALAAVAYALTPADWLPTRSGDLRATAGVLALYALVNLQGSILQAAFQSSGLYARGITMSALTSLTEGVVAAVAVLSGASMIVVAFGYLTCRTLSFAVQTILLHRWVSWLSLGVGRRSREEIGRLWRPAVATMALPLAQSLYLQGAPLAILLNASPAAVPAFTAVRTFTRVGIQLSTMVNHAIMPEMAGAYALRNDKLQHELIAFTLFTSAAIVAPLSVGILAFGQSFVALWTHGAIHPSLTLIAIMTLNMVVQAFWIPLSNLLLATNRQQSYSYTYLIASAGFTALAFVATYELGSDGAAWAMLGLDLYMAVNMVNAVSRILVPWRNLIANATVARDLTGRLVLLANRLGRSSP